MPKTITDITHELDHVHGGGAAKAIASGAKAAWNVAKPWFSRADKAVETFSKYGGGALAAKEGYDLMAGGNGGGSKSTPAPAPEGD